MVAPLPAAPDCSLGAADFSIADNHRFQKSSAAHPAVAAHHNFNPDEPTHWTINAPAPQCTAPGNPVRRSFISGVDQQ